MSAGMLQFNEVVLDRHLLQLPAIHLAILQGLAELCQQHCTTHIQAYMPQPSS